MIPWRRWREENDREDVDSDDDGAITTNFLQRPEYDDSVTPPADPIFTLGETIDE